MGYRLDIDMVGKSNPICCGKLLGYEDYEKYKTYKWLYEKDFIENDQYFGYGFEGNFLLRGYELKEFLKLYIEDLDTDYQYDNTDLKKEIEEYIKNITDDYDKYILMWG